jgi:hypothetical protein
MKRFFREYGGVLVGVKHNEIKPGNSGVCLSLQFDDVKLGSRTAFEQNPTLACSIYYTFLHQQLIACTQSDP